MSRIPETRAPSADEFNRGNALSATTQPYFEDLLEVLADSSKKIVFFVGAGVSIDAGYPSWPGLISRLAQKISDPRFANLAASDLDGVLRQAETVFRLIAPDSPQDDAGTLREVLYRTHGEPTSGPLADTLARICVALGDRCSLMTTNFDDVLEAALEKETGTAPRAYSLRGDYYDPEDRVPASLDLYPGYAEWLQHRETDGAMAVMHLHGMTRRRDDPLRPLVLTESHFLRYGSAVREVILRELREHVVIFIGASLNDPNVTGPLWDLAQFEAGQTNHPIFALHVPGYVEGAADVHEARAYGLAKYQYLETALGVSPIFLKSYSQLLQLLFEMDLCIRLGRDYLDRKSASPWVYGHRFERVLDRCYERATGRSRGTPALSDREQFAKKVEVSESLRAILADQHPVGRKLHSRPTGELLTRHRSLRRRHDDMASDREEEQFGLFLWLRTPRTEDGSPVPYAIDLVASSTYAHFEDWSGRRTALIESGSKVIAAECAFEGLAKLGNLPLVSRFPLWRSALAFPLRISEETDPSGEVVVGAVSLNSTFSIDFARKERGSVSILAAFKEVQTELETDVIAPLRDAIADLLR